MTQTSWSHPNYLLVKHNEKRTCRGDSVMGMLNKSISSLMAVI